MFKNEFSWSKSRHDLFNDCQRKYYYNYYGSWNGWGYQAKEPAKTLYRLKKLQNRKMWLGSAVHLAIEAILKDYRAGNTVNDLDWQKNKMLNVMRGEFSKSRDGVLGKKSWKLFEHEYDHEISNEEWKACADQAEKCLENFWNSEEHKKVKDFTLQQWLEIEDFSFFFIEGVKVHVVLDFSYIEGDEIFIFDWKTGQATEGMHELQLACYRIYASKQWENLSKKIRTFDFNLNHNKINEYEESDLSIDEAMVRIKDSIRIMQDKLVSVSQNTAEEDSFPFTENESKCSYCVFKKACKKFQ